MEAILEPLLEPGQPLGVVNCILKAVTRSVSATEPMCHSPLRLHPSFDFDTDWLSYHPRMSACRSVGRNLPSRQTRKVMAYWRAKFEVTSWRLN